MTADRNRPSKPRTGHRARQLMRRTKILTCWRCGNKFFAICDCAPLKTLAEAEEMFAGCGPPDCDLFVERQGTLPAPVALLGKQTASPTALTERREPYWQSSRSPIAALLFENAGDSVTTASATIVLKVPCAELVPIAFDEQLAATGTPCAAAVAIMHVSSVNVVEPL